MGLLVSDLFLSPLLVAFVGPGCAVFARLRLRVVLAVACAPVAVVVLAMFASAPTSWGHQAAGDVTNTGSLVYLTGFTLVATVAGLVIAAVTAAVSRFARRPRP